MTCHLWPLCMKMVKMKFPEFLRVAILEQPGLRGQMSSGQNWFDSVINTTQYGGSSDEKILDLSPTVLAQQPFQSSDLGSR